MINRRKILLAIGGILSLPKLLSAKETEDFSRVDEWWEVAKIKLNKLYEYQPKPIMGNTVYFYTGFNRSLTVGIYGQYFSYGNPIAENVWPTEAEFNELNRRVLEYRPF